MTNINVVPDFVRGGKATFTVSNTNGTHYTYHIYKAKKRHDASESEREIHFAQVLTGPNNNNPDDFTYLGMILWPKSDAGDPVLHRTKNSRFQTDAPSFKGLQWALRAIWQVHRGTYILPASHTIQHVGRCGRCGAKLTNPASLDTGLGPECAALVGADYGERSRQIPFPSTADAVEKLRERRRHGV